MESCWVESQHTISGQEEEEEQWFSYAMQLMTMMTMPMVLNAAVKLDVLEIIAKAGPGGKLSPSEIVSQMPTKNPDAPDFLDRMLRLLAGYSVLTCSVVDGGAGAHHERRYGLAPVAKYFIKHQYGATLRQLSVYLQNKLLMDSWYQLEASVLEGGNAFKRTHGCELYEYMTKDPRYNEAFNNAMSCHTKVVLEKALECYKGFENLKTLADVGGAVGQAIHMITSKYPNIKGINFDLPHVIEVAPSYPGIEHKGGDMFESVPEADAIFMKWILHNWDDEHCLKLLRNCYKALPNDGKVIVVDAIVPVNPENSEAAAKSNMQIDLFMMAVCSPGAKGRSELEFRALATKAGFRGIRVECRLFDLWVLEFYK
ncbi:caffeic acid 3-O-methyltransferase [Coffea arabica]|uniref:Caffeic acid 3-O-methyltransferase n=1 Tax=Coffea arabica TaxID=13443 RepID=A0A6P6TPQ7_COFAR|nr:caffeic acid 3-O-methyltransferase-like [Coffea arabica]XP_027079580.1 caffeic acid 3-O-methyltransferase-like [Coffea arabica]XP_027079581.1 caffeic acid 3-O-methyltransferase-like [Coffea arabica]